MFTVKDLTHLCKLLDMQNCIIFLFIKLDCIYNMIYILFSLPTNISLLFTVCTTHFELYFLAEVMTSLSSHDQ